MHRSGGGWTQGNTVSFLDLMFEDNIQRSVEKSIEENKPDVVGISVRNIDNNNVENPRSFFRDVQELSVMIRKKTQAKIVLGGAAILIMPEQFLRLTDADAAILGNGEFVFPKLLTAIQQGKGFKEVTGIGWLENDIYKRNDPFVEQSKTLSDCLVPDFFRWINVKEYLSKFSTVPVQTKRGCPYKCIYCTYSIGEGQNYQLCKPESVVREIKKLACRGLRDIEFVDNVFNSPYEHAMEICSRLASARLAVHLQTMEINPKFVDDTLLTAMEEAGFVGIGVTAESADDLVIESLGKDYTAEDVRRAAGIINRHKIPCFWMFLLAGPGENNETIERTLDFARNFIRPCDTVCFTDAIRIYPGTPLENVARGQGILNVPAGEMMEPVFYFSPQLKRQWLYKKLEEAIKANLNFIDSQSFSLPALAVVQRLAYYLGIKQPIWKHTRFLRRGMQLLGAYK